MGPRTCICDSYGKGRNCGKSVWPIMTAINVGRIMMKFKRIMSVISAIGTMTR